MATQTSAGSGGSFGVGGGNTYTGFIYASPGGGGGWYGGGGGKHSDTESSYIHYAGGGSGYVYTSNTASNYPSGCLLNSSYYLADAYTINGYAEITSPSGSTETGHSGNGYARITYNKTKSDPRYQTTNFSYKSEAQEYIVPQTGKYLLEVWGAQGGNGYRGAGGKGGYSKGIIQLVEGTKLYIYTGGKGTDTGTSYSTGTKAGGFNRRRNGKNKLLF